MATAGSRKRPRSRASTASIHSVTTEANADHSFSMDDSGLMATERWLEADNESPNKKRAGSLSQLAPEELLMQAAEQLQAAGDLSLEAAQRSDGIPLAPAPMANVQDAGNHSFMNDSSYFEADSQMLDAMDDGDSNAGTSGQARQGSRSSANNEKEMLQLFGANKNRTLQEVAEELHGNERGPNSERTRQVFAMLWLNTVCSKGKGSVPRGRVYANYASRCATERITVLNPASFGKLVRVLFPGLKTRRLGVRGESKYHYVNFMLKEDQNGDGESSAQLPLVFGEMGSRASMPPTGNAYMNLASAPAQSRSIQLSPNLAQQPLAVPTRSREFTHSLYNQPLVGSVEQLQANMGKTAQKWAFVSEAEDAFQQSDPLLLPRIEPFLPSGTDVDAAKSLAALYRSHCTSLVECIRYCKEKTFFHLFTSFQGTLTMPVQKLFSNPVLAPWIEESDFVMYQRMMRIVSNLTLQVVPKPVLDTLRNISERLVRHIRDSFQGQPQHVVRAKEAPATIFASLLDRALRVNLTAHAAANMLANPANRDVMYMEWITLVSPRKVAESVPSRGMDDVVELLLAEMRDILDPVNVPWALEGMTLQGDMAVRTGRQPAPEQMVGTNASNVLDRWVAFLRSLPQRFPYASPTDIVWCVQRVGTAVMRDITISQGKSFGSWWVTKCWIDEMIQYLAEQGGFMLQTSTRTLASESAPPRTAASSQGASHHSSRYSSASEDFNMSHVSHRSQSAAPEPQLASAEAVAEPGDGSMGGVDGQANHDDSGIGIRTPDEDVPLDKLVFPTPDARDLFAGTELQSPALA